MQESISAADKTNLILSVGTHRKNRRLLPIEVAELIAKWKSSESTKNIAVELGLKGTSMLNRFLSLLKLPKELQPLISWGNSPGYMSFSVACEVARSSEEKVIDILAKDAIENQRTKEEVRSIFQRYQRSNQDIFTAISEISRRRPEIIPLHIFVGQITEDKLAGRSEFKDEDLFVSLEKFFGEGNLFSAAIRDNRFSFTVIESALEQVEKENLDAKNIESFIANLLS